MLPYNGEVGGLEFKDLKVFKVFKDFKEACGLKQKEERFGRNAPLLLCDMF